MARREFLAVAHFLKRNDHLDVVGKAVETKRDEPYVVRKDYLGWFTRTLLGLHLRMYIACQLSSKASCH